MMKKKNQSASFLYHSKEQGELGKTDINKNKGD